MRYDLKPIVCFKISSFKDLVIYGVLSPFYPKTRLPGPQSTSSERRLSVAKSFQKQLTPHNRGESLSIDKVLSGPLIEFNLHVPHESIRAPRSTWGLLSW